MRKALSIGAVVVVVLFVSAAAYLLWPRGDGVVDRIEVGMPLFVDAQSAMAQNQAVGAVNEVDKEPGNITVMDKGVLTNETHEVHKIVLMSDERTPPEGETRPDRYVRLPLPEEEPATEDKPKAMAQGAQVESTTPWGLYIGVLFAALAIVGLPFYFGKFLALADVEGDLGKASLYGLPEMVENLFWRVFLHPPRTADDWAQYRRVGKAMAKIIVTDLITNLLRDKLRQVLPERVEDVLSEIRQTIMDEGLPGLRRRTGQQVDLATFGGPDGIDYKEMYERYRQQQMEDERIAEHRSRLDANRQQIFDDWMKKDGVTPDMAFEAAMSGGEIVPKTRVEVHPNILGAFTRGGSGNE